jgi:hypothetical protein
MVSFDGSISKTLRGCVPESETLCFGRGVAPHFISAITKVTKTKDMISSSPKCPGMLAQHWIYVKLREFNRYLLCTAQLIEERRNQYISYPLIGLIGRSARPLIKRALV